MSELGE